MHADPAYVNEAFKAGASGYLLKRSAGSELLQAVQSVMDGQCYVTPLVAKGLVESAITRKMPVVLRDKPLTGRQREVLQLVAEGKTVKEIASALTALTEDGRISQIADYDAARSSHDGGAHQVRPCSRPPCIGLVTALA